MAADLSPPPQQPPHRSTNDFFSDPLNSTPLWFKQHAFLDPTFDSEIYIAELRTFVPFDTLRAHLQSHLSSLKYELVDLINRDYNDFVNLSTKLVDVDGAIVRMRAPLLELRDKIGQFRDGVQSSLVSLQNGLRQRAEAAATREVLELLLDTFHVVSKIEKLIKELPSVPADQSYGDTKLIQKDPMCNGTSFQLSENGTNIRETQSMLLERIASEMNRLKFYIAHTQNLPFIENMEKRIQTASLLLDSSLGHCFADGLKHRDQTAIYNCLRAYAAIDNTNAEEIFRTTVVSPVIHSIFPSESSAANGTNQDELENDYQQIKHYIEKDCKFLLEISSEENSGLHVFNFLANSILKEVLSAIQKAKPGAFSPGRPKEFLQNYRSSMDFLGHLEGYCPSKSAVVKLRAEAVYIDFMKQWNINVYFSLRFQEIAGSLDSALTAGSLTPLQASGSGQRNSQEVILKQSCTLLESLRSCWREDVIVFSIADRFLSLTLQLLSRYANWLSSGLAARENGNSGFIPGSDWAIAAAPEDFIYIIHDINCLVTVVSGDYLEDVGQLLSSCSKEVIELAKQSILQGGNALNDLLPQVMRVIIEALVEKPVTDLRQVKGITAAYRMKNKPLPVRHSPYVLVVLRPLKAFLDGELATKYLTSETSKELLNGAAAEITGRYFELAAELVSTTKKTESSLQRMRQSALKRAGANSDVADNNVSDTEKVCMQLFLDIQEYGRNLSALGLDPTKIESYPALLQSVTRTDRKNTINLLSYFYTL